MSTERETQILSKRQTKRNIERHVQELLEECNQREEIASSYLDVSHTSIPHSVNDYLDLNIHLDVDQNLNLNPVSINASNTRQQCYDLDIESVHTISDMLERPDEVHNITPEILEESYVTEKHFVDHEALQNNLQNKLQYWALAHNVTLSALDELLSILKVSHPDMPLTGRSLLYTPRNTRSINLQNGKFTYFGICNQLKRLLQKQSVSKVIELDFNFDGLPLFKSNSTGVWPILCRSLNFTSLHTPFIVALFTGKRKPEPIHLYLEDFVQELDNILYSGIQIGGTLFPVKIRSIICDAPARAFIKCCVNHNSRYGCEKCSVEGEYINHKMIFPCTSGQLRTKDSFNEQINEEHHKGVSPLQTLNIDLVNQVPLDSMHLVYLGVMKKLLTIWISKGKPPFKLSANSISKLSDKLLMMSPYIPQEFSRKPRTLSEVNRWKATEFRLFLLYVGPIALRSILPKQLYDHFLMLHVGITILNNNDYISKYIDFAEQVINKFVKYIAESYGKQMITYNIHSLIHLVSDVRNLGNLNTFNCFPFENYLGKLKTLVRSSANPHEQLCRRIHEMSQFAKRNVPIIELEPTQKHSEGPIFRRGSHSILQYRKLKTQTYVLSIFSPDNCVSIQGDIVIQILNILRLQDQSYCLIGRRFQTVCEFYNYPCSSKLLNIFKVSCISSSIEEFPFISVIRKNILIPANEEETYIVLPLLHE